MAKVTDKETKTTPVEEDLFAGMTPEQIQEILELTGQTANAGYDKTPVLKINQFSSDIQDNIEESKRVKMGNFVLNQSTEKDGDNDVIKEIGEDCGAKPEVTILKVGQRFNYFPKNKDKKQICQSQLILDVGEQAVGDKFGYNCKDKSCPMRDENRDKEDRCKCQYEVFLLVGPEKKPAKFFAKGESFIPFSKCIEDAGKFPMFFYPVILTTEKKTKGTNTYWVITPELQKDRPYPAPERIELMNQVKDLDAAVRGNESKRKLLAAGRKTEAQKQLPPGMTMESPNKSGGGSALGGADVSDAEFADIKFD